MSGKKRGRPKKEKPVEYEYVPQKRAPFSESGLYPYQKTCCKKVIDAWSSGQDKALIVMATGSGKTIVASHILGKTLREGEKALFLAHRGELLTQAQDKIKWVSGLDCSFEKASLTAVGSKDPVVLGSVQTMLQDKRLQSFPRDYFSTIIVDEAHHAVSDSYQKILNYFRARRILGMTATPDRMDERKIEGYFNPAVFEYPIKQGIKEEHLAPIRVQMIPLQLDISGVSIQNGDFSAGELGGAIEPHLEAVAKEMRKRCSDRKTIVFLPTVRSATTFARILKEKGFRSAFVSGKTPQEQRDGIYRDLKTGKINVICNAMVLTEGFDETSVNCIICLRPTQSRSLYQQIVGRGLRYDKDKEYCLLLDFLWLTKQHDLCHPSAIVAPDAEIAEKLDKRIADGEILDLLEAEEEEEEDRRTRMEQRLRLELEKRIREEEEEARLKAEKEEFEKNEMLVDPLLFASAIKSDELLTYRPAWPWEQESPTQKQIETLKNRGINTNRIKTKGQASILLKELFRRQDNNLCTPKQMRVLQNMGFSKVSDWTFEKAGKEIDTVFVMPTVKAISLLVRYGYSIPWEWTKAEAKEVISALQQNSWKIPMQYPEGYRPPRLGRIKGSSQPSSNEVSVLVRSGYNVTDRWNYGDCAKLITELGKEKWENTQGASDYVPPRLKEEKKAKKVKK